MDPMTGTFMLFVHAPSDGWADLDDEAMKAALQDRAAAIETLRTEGALLACSPLADPAEARRVEVRDGRRSSTPGAVDDEPIAGFYLVRADDIAEAERLAAQIPDSASAHITVRALMPLPGIPGVIPSAAPREVPRD
jgi:hypothetical protein